jgi:hypothetical protein
MTHVFLFVFDNNIDIQNCIKELHSVSVYNTRSLCITRSSFLIGFELPQLFSVLYEFFDLIGNMSSSS